MSEPKYSEEQLSAILRDAATRDATTRDVTDGASYSLADIQRIAEEAGIAPHLVAQAAQSLPVAVERSTVLAGAASGMQVVRRIERSASQAEVLEALSLVRQRLSQTGETRDVGGAVEWRYDTGYSGTTVTILSDASGTMIRVDGRADGRQFILYFGAVAAAVMTGFIASTTATPTFSAVGAAIALVPYVVAARFWWNRSSRAFAETLSRLADDVAEQLRRP